MKERCVLGEYCFRHKFIHGAEAEELRERIEKALKGADHEGQIDEEDLQAILDEVDARDSLAYLEIRAETERS